MNPESLNLSHKQFITNKLRKMAIPFSEFTFGNLFVTREEREYLLYQGEGIYFIKGKSTDEKTLIIPLDPVDIHFKEYMALLEENRDYHLFPLPKEWCDLFPDDRYHKERNDGWDDYVYQTKKIALYNGRALDGRRNQVKHFLQDYSFEVLEIDESTIPDALKVLSIWKEKHDNGIYDTVFAKEGLDNFKELGLEGIVIKSEGIPISFAFGEMLLEGIFDVEFAKSDHDYRGVSPLLFQQLAIRLEDRYEWLNYEIDLGLVGLRKNKTEYVPDRMERKWRVKAR